MMCIMILDFETKAVELPEDHGDELRLWLRLLTCTTLIEGEVRSRLRERFDVTLPRFDLMAQLDKVPEGMTLSDVSKRMMVSNGNVTGLVERLVESGHLDRRTSDADRRVQVIRLTKAGRAEFRKMAAEHETWIADIFRRPDAEGRPRTDASAGQDQGVGAEVREGASGLAGRWSVERGCGLRGRIQQPRAGSGESRDHRRLVARRGGLSRGASGAPQMIPYGTGERNRIDLFSGDGAGADRGLHPRRLLAGAGWFVLQSSRAGLNAHGIDVAVPSYDLCPAVSVAEIIGEMRAASRELAQARAAARRQRPFRRRPSRRLHAGDRLARIRCVAARRTRDRGLRHLGPVRSSSAGQHIHQHRLEARRCVGKGGKPLVLEVAVARQRWMRWSEATRAPNISGRAAPSSTPGALPASRRDLRQFPTPTILPPSRRSPIPIRR